MNKIFLITTTILNFLELTQVQAFPFSDNECRNYLKKFGTSNATFPQLDFTGDVSFITGTGHANVNLRYSDEEYFNDPKYFGLVKEDGKTSDTVCLDLKLFKYTSNNYSDPVQVTDLPITPSNNTQNKWRYYSFIIPGNELRDRLVETNNGSQYIYNGYYAIAYYATGTELLQYKFSFEFSLIIDNATEIAVETLFFPQIYKSTLYCSILEMCQHIADTELKWCTNTTCLEYGTPDLHLNDQFVLQQVVTSEAMKGYYLTGTEVWYTGHALNKRAAPLSINNTKPGQTIIQLKAEIARNNVQIRVSSTLSNTSGRRVLVQTESDQVTGETQLIECIKAEGSETCPTCEQECEVNGIAEEGCPPCSLSFQVISNIASPLMAFIFLPLFLAFTI